MPYKILLLFLIAHLSGSVSAQNLERMWASSRVFKYYGEQDKLPPTYFSSEKFGKTLASNATVHPLEKTGKVLTLVGIPLLIIGGIMVAGADELSYQCYNGDCQGDAQGAFGILFLAAGVGLSTTGIVLWSIGSKKTKQRRNSSAKN